MLCMKNNDDESWKKAIRKAFKNVTVCVGKLLCFHGRAHSHFIQGLYSVKRTYSARDYKSICSNCNTQRATDQMKSKNKRKKIRWCLPYLFRMLCAFAVHRHILSVPRNCNKSFSRTKKNTHAIQSDENKDSDCDYKDNSQRLNSAFRMLALNTLKYVTLLNFSHANFSLVKPRSTL